VRSCSRYWRSSGPCAWCASNPSDRWPSLRPEDQGRVAHVEWAWRTTGTRLARVAILVTVSPAGRLRVRLAPDGRGVGDCGGPACRALGDSRETAGLTCERAPEKTLRWRPARTRSRRRHRSGCGCSSSSKDQRARSLERPLARRFPGRSSARRGRANVARFDHGRRWASTGAARQVADNSYALRAMRCSARRRAGSRLATCRAKWLSAASPY
jgi:hypothetical protein